MIESILSSAVAAVPAPAPVSAAPSAERVGAFQDAMSRHAVSDPATVAGAGRTEAVGEASAANADANARQGLGLEGAAPPATGGDMILQGFERMRGVFDARETRIGELMKSNMLDAGKLMEMQLEVTNFTLLVDMSSKLTGKATQTFDTLMKGS